MGTPLDRRKESQGFGDVSNGSPDRADRPTSRRVCLVVVEAGARRLEERVSHGESEHTVVITQSANEQPAAAASSTIRCIALLELSSYCIERTILMLAPRYDVEATAARVALARALASHSANTNAGAPEMLLRASGTSESPVHAGVLTLVDLLGRDPGSCSLPVRVQFPGALSPGVGSGFALSR